MKNLTFFYALKCKGICLLALTFVFTMSYAQSDYAIQFQDETLEIPENIDSFQWNQMPESSEFNNGYVGWVQFYETPNQTIQDRFKSNNLKLIEYIPYRTYLFHFPNSTSINFLKENGVRSIIPVQGRFKISPELKNPPYQEWAIEGNNILVTLQFYDGVSTEYVIADLALKQIAVKQQYTGYNTIDLSIPNNCLEELSNLPYVKWVELIVAPSIPDDLNGRGLHRSNNLDTQTGAGRNYDGTGIGVMVRDDGGLGPHIDFQGRIVSNVGGLGGSHGDGVGGIMAGAGNFIPKYRGMAAGSDIYVVNYVASFLDTATTTQITNGNVQITNSSYSNGCNAGYTGIAVTVDTQIKDNPTIIHVFSAGNSNGSNCGYGAGTQWGNITGGHKQGKNVLTTANVYANGTLESSSSRGPGHDGRIKPDITAHGQGQVSTNANNTYQTFGGTSAAAPGIAGVTAQLYQVYTDANGGTLPQSALIKAAILNTANDVGNVGPDYKFGWGIINGLRAGMLIEDDRFLSDNVSQGGSNTHNISVPAGTTQVRFMLYWSDTPAGTGANPALVNDLDLLVTDPSAGTHEPWILDHTPNPVTLDDPATLGPDHLNNMEQVLINSPAAGTYDLDITGFDVPFGPQEYFVVYEIITEELTLTYPNAGESFAPSEDIYIQWDAINTTADFDLEYSADNGSSWNTITTVGSTVSLYFWDVPNDITGEALVRVTSGAFQDESDDVFSIANLVGGLNVIEVCPTDATFEWAAVADAESYDLYVLGDKYMEVAGNSTTTSITIPITDPNDEMWYAIVAKNDTDGWVSHRTNAKRHPGGLLNCVLAIGDVVLEEAVTLYPNPSSDTVFIEMNNLFGNSFEVIVTNSLGQTLRRIKDTASNETATLNVSGYATGLYFVTIKVEGQSITKKLVVR